jgi:hypothetical protein
MLAHVAILYSEAPSFYMSAFLMIVDIISFYIYPSTYTFNIRFQFCNNYLSY